MESSTRTEDLELAGEPAATAVASPEIHPLMTTAVRERCPACGVAMAADQRYCVECGERRGAPRVALLEGPAARAREQQRAPNPPAPRQRGGLANNTLIAIIGMLLLAMGIGVLIGRSNNNANVKNAPPQVVTVSVAGTPSTGASATQPTTTGSSVAPTSTSPSSTTKTKSKAPAAKPKSTTPAPKAVKVGTAGHGRGYQNGHFTGNFFGE